MADVEHVHRPMNHPEGPCECATFPATYGPCLGGCGRIMPPGQKCIECAAGAVDAWVRSRRPGAIEE